jgi:hypothetical protein
MHTTVQACWPEAPPERRGKIVQGRIRKLERQIQSFRRQLEECEKLHRHP